MHKFINAIKNDIIFSSFKNAGYTVFILCLYGTLYFQLDDWMENLAMTLVWMHVSFMVFGAAVILFVNIIFEKIVKNARAKTEDVDKLSKIVSRRNISNYVVMVFVVLSLYINNHPVPGGIYLVSGIFLLGLYENLRNQYNKMVVDRLMGVDQ